jgi:hypothetical protein
MLATQRFPRLPKIFQIPWRSDWTQNDNQLRFTRRTQGAEDRTTKSKGLRDEDTTDLQRPKLQNPRNC